MMRLVLVVFSLFFFGCTLFLGNSFFDIECEIAEPAVCSNDNILTFCEDGIRRSILCGEGSVCNAENLSCGVCGDGVLDQNEFCDDNNIINGDGCDNTCVVSTCGNDEKDTGEICYDNIVTFPVTGVRPIAIALGDFNKDTRLDLAVANRDSDEVSILLNDETQGFFTETALPIISPITTVNKTAPADIVPLDIDNDNDIDLVVSTSESREVHVLLNDGTGEFSFGFVIPSTTLTGATAMAVGDWDENGNIDLVVTTGDNNVNSALIFNNTANSSFNNEPLSETVGDFPIDAIAGDLDGDNKDDIVISNHFGNSLSVFKNNGGFANFAEVLLPNSFSPIGAGQITLSDLDKDNDLDIIVVGAFDSTLHILQNNSSPQTFDFDIISIPIENPDGNVFGVVAADFNQDDFLDLAILIVEPFPGFGKSDSEKIGILLRNSDVVFDKENENIFSQTIFLDGGDFSNNIIVPILAGDLNGDSLPDIIVPNGDDNTIGVYFSTF